MTKIKWKENIKLAKALVGGLDRHRWQITELAMDCCEQSRGQRGNDSEFTYKKFCVAIDIEYKTLINWVRIKKLVVDKLTVKQRDGIKEIPVELLKRTCDKVDEFSTPRFVRNILKEEAGVDPNRIRFIKYIKNVKTVLYNVSRPVRLIEITDDDLIMLNKLTNLITNLTNKEIEFRRQFGKPSGIDDIANIDSFRKKLEEMV